MEKFFDKLPYESLEGVKTVHVILAVFGIGLLLGIGYYFTLYSSNQEEMAKLENKRVELDKTLKRYQLLVAEKKTVTQRLALVTADLEDMKSQMPKTDEIPGLLKRVADMGKGLGLQVLLFQLNEGSVNDYYKAIPVSINFRGGIWKTLDFFDGMQNLLRLVDFAGLEMDVKTVDLMNSEGRLLKAFPMLHTRFTAKTYSYVDGAENKIPSGQKKK